MHDANRRMFEPIDREASLAESVRILFRELPPSPRPFGIALAAFVSVLGFTLVVKEVVGIDCIDTIFLIVVAGVAIQCGLWPALACAVVSALAYDFVFVPSAYVFKELRPDSAATLLIFILGAVVASHLAARIRAETSAARRCADTAEALYISSRRIAEITDLDELLQATVQQIATMLDLEAVLLLPDEAGKLVVRASSPSCRGISAPGCEEPGGGHAGDTHFLDLRTKKGVVGQVGIARRRSHAARDESLLSGDQQKTLDAILSQAAVAIERIQLSWERDEARQEAETERLRSALLTSLSHDLKTPLASILGAITALRQDRELYDDVARDELEAMIQDGAERLGRFVTNLLDMTRLEVGAIVPNRQPVDLGEVIGTSLKVAAPLLERHTVQVDLAPDLPILDLDAGLLEHVIVNLLDNASKYAPAGSVVAIGVRRDSDSIVIQIADQGPGLPPGVFERFRETCPGGRPSAGTGLGLAICRGFVEALGGRIRACNRTDAPGAVFTITFPQALVSPAKTEAGDP